MSEEIKVAEVAEKPVKHSKVSTVLNGYFHHIDRGSSLRREITAGILLCILSVCGIFMNMQLITQMTTSGAYAEATVEQVAQNGEIIASTYFVSMLVAFVGSLVIGLVARLPFVQISGLGLSTVMISLVGSSSGLTYYNLVAVCLLSSVVYAVLVSVPVVRKFIVDGIPPIVRKAVPAAVGILIAFAGLQLSGLISIFGTGLKLTGAGTAIGNASESLALPKFLNLTFFDYTTDRFHPTLLLCAICSVLTLVLILVFKARKSKHPYLWSLLIATAAYIVLCVLTVTINWAMMTFTTDSLLGRAWMVGSEDAMQTHLSAVFANWDFGKVFTEGFDFSGYTGNVFLLFLTGMLTMLFSFTFQNDATVAATGFAESEGKSVKIALMCNAGANVVASVFGASPVSISQESCAAVEDGARSGIASVVAAIGFLISAFVWIIPAVFVTATSSAIQMNLYGHHGKVLQLLTECSFSFADMVMVAIGLSMVKRSLGFDYKDAATTTVWLATVFGTLVLSNVAYGVALGCVIYTALEMLKKPTEGKTKLQSLRAIGIPVYVFTAVSLLMLILSVCL